MDFELTEGQRMLQKMARDFADKEIEPVADRVDRECKIPLDMLRKMAGVGLTGIIASHKYGGLGQGFLSYILVLEQIHYPCSACTWLVMGQGMCELFERFGTEEQKKEYIPPIVKGEVLPSGAFTEAATGSDPRLFVTTAVLQDGHWIINGSKRFCTWGHFPGFGVFYCKTDGDRISSIIVPRNVSGYTCSEPWQLMGLGGVETVDVELRDVRVPEKNLLGERGKAGEVLTEMVAGGRLAIAIRSVACGQRAMDEAIQYAKQRRTFRGPISNMQGHRWLLAEMLCRVEASRWLTYRASSLKEQGKDVRMEASVAKLFASQAGEWVASQAVQIHGAYGYTKECKVERIYRAAKQSLIAEGVSEAQRTIIGTALVRD